MELREAELTATNLTVGKEGRKGSRQGIRGGRHRLRQGGYAGTNHFSQGQTADRVLTRLANPFEAKRRMAKSNKTDALDARGLAILLRCGTLPESWIPPGELRDQRELLRTRMRVSCPASSPAAATFATAAPAATSTAISSGPLSKRPTAPFASRPTARTTSASSTTGSIQTKGTAVPSLLSPATWPRLLTGCCGNNKSTAPHSRAPSYASPADSQLRPSSGKRETRLVSAKTSG